MTPPVPAADLAAWCTEHLGSAPAGELFRSGHLSTVVGLRLADGRAVVVKVRPASPRTAACVAVQRRLSDAGYPCPEPLTGAVPLGDGQATAEAFVPGGAGLPGPGDAARLSAAAFARLVRLAPRPAELPSLTAPPSWTAWDQGEARLWPEPEGGGVDLDTADVPAWLHRAGVLARDRLRDGAGPVVVGHGDWLADNVRWQGDQLLVVHDWDSVVADSEDVLVGLAAALCSTDRGHELATVEGTERFLAGYGAARGRPLDVDELQRAWAAGLWTRAYDATYQHVTGHPVTSLSQAEAGERLRRAGLG